MSPSSSLPDVNENVTPVRRVVLRPSLHDSQSQQWKSHKNDVGDRGDVSQRVDLRQHGLRDVDSIHRDVSLCLESAFPRLGVLPRRESRMNATDADEDDTDSIVLDGASYYSCPGECSWGDDEEDSESCFAMHGPSTVGLTQDSESCFAMHGPSTVGLAQDSESCFAMHGPSTVGLAQDGNRVVDEVARPRKHRSVFLVSTPVRVSRDHALVHPPLICSNQHRRCLVHRPMGDVDLVSPPTYSSRRTNTPMSPLRGSFTTRQTERPVVASHPDALLLHHLESNSSENSMTQCFATQQPFCLPLASSPSVRGSRPMGHSAEIPLLRISDLPSSPPCCSRDSLLRPSCPSPRRCYSDPPAVSCDASQQDHKQSHSRSDSPSQLLSRSLQPELPLYPVHSHPHLPDPVFHDRPPHSQRFHAPRSESPVELALEDTDLKTHGTNLGVDRRGAVASPLVHDVLPVASPDDDSIHRLGGLDVSLYGPGLSLPSAAGADWIPRGQSSQSQQPQQQQIHSPSNDLLSVSPSARPQSGHDACCSVSPCLFSSEQELLTQRPRFIPFLFCKDAPQFSDSQSLSVSPTTQGALDTNAHRDQESVTSPGPSLPSRFTLKHFFLDELFCDRLCRHYYPTVPASTVPTVPVPKMRSSRVLLQTTTSDNSPLVSDHIPKNQIRHLVQLPRSIERMLFFGVTICLQSVLYELTFMPIQATIASVKLLAIGWYSIYQKLQILHATMFKCRRAHSALTVRPAIVGTMDSGTRPKTLEHLQSSLYTGATDEGPISNFVFNKECEGLISNSVSTPSASVLYRCCAHLQGLDQKHFPPNGLLSFLYEFVSSANTRRQCWKSLQEFWKRMRLDNASYNRSVLQEMSTALADVLIPKYPKERRSPEERGIKVSHQRRNSTEMTSRHTPTINDVQLSSSLTMSRHAMRSATDSPLLCDRPSGCLKSDAGDISTSIILSSTTQAFREATGRQERWGIRSSMMKGFGSPSTIVNRRADPQSVRPSVSCGETMELSHPALELPCTFLGMSHPSLGCSRPSLGLSDSRTGDHTVQQRRQPSTVGTPHESCETVRESVGTGRQSVGTVRESVGKVRESVGKARESVGTVHESVGTVKQSKPAAVSSFPCLLSRPQACDLSRTVMLLLGVWLFHTFVDISEVYHFIRAQSLMKMYVIFNMLEIFERLWRSVGVDALDSLMRQVVSWPVVSQVGLSTCTQSASNAPSASPKRSTASVFPGTTHHGSQPIPPPMTIHSSPVTVCRREVAHTLSSILSPVQTSQRAARRRLSSPLLSSSSHQYTEDSLRSAHADTRRNPGIVTRSPSLNVPGPSIDRFVDCRKKYRVPPWRSESALLLRRSLTASSNRPLDSSPLVRVAGSSLSPVISSSMRRLSLPHSGVLPPVVVLPASKSNVYVDEQLFVPTGTPVPLALVQPSTGSASSASHHWHRSSPVSPPCPITIHMHSIPFVTGLSSPYLPQSMVEAVSEASSRRSFELSSQGTAMEQHSIRGALHLPVSPQLLSSLSPPHLTPPLAEDQTRCSNAPSNRTAGSVPKGSNPSLEPMSPLRKAWRMTSKLGHLVLSIALVLIYVVVHSCFHLIRVLLLNISINSSDSVLFLIVTTNNFAEIKSTVFKKFTRTNLFTIAASDAVERFYLFADALIVFLRLSFSSRPPIVSYFSVSWWLISMLLLEFLVDWFKHAFLLKLNFIECDVFEEYQQLLFADILVSRMKFPIARFPSTSSKDQQLERIDNRETNRLMNPMEGSIHHLAAVVDYDDENILQATLSTWSTPCRGFYSFPHVCARRIGFVGLPLTAQLLCCIPRFPLRSFPFLVTFTAVLVWMNLLLLKTIVSLWLVSYTMSCKPRLKGLDKELDRLAAL